MSGDTSTQTETKRLKILEAEEIEAVYGLPVFDDDDRAFYFALSPPERAILSQLHGLKSSIYYILQLGYFKARRQFFVFNLQQVVADAQYVQRSYFPDYALVDLDITKVTRLKQQGLILELLQYRVCGEEERQQTACKSAAGGANQQPSYLCVPRVNGLPDQTAPHCPRLHRYAGNDRRCVAAGERKAHCYSQIPPDR